MWNHFLRCTQHGEWILLTTQTHQTGHIIRPWNAELFKAFLCAFMECHGECYLDVVRESETPSGSSRLNPPPIDFALSTTLKRFIESQPTSWQALVLTKYSDDISNSGNPSDGK